MTTAKSLAAVLPIVSLAVGAVYATPPPIVYPAKGQTAEQQQKDSTECAAWAKQSTGIDPAAVEAAPAQPTTAQPAPDDAPKGERVKGAARGAAARSSHRRSCGRRCGQGGGGRCSCGHGRRWKTVAQERIEGGGAGRSGGTTGEGGRRSGETGETHDLQSRDRRVHGRPRLHDQVTTTDPESPVRHGLAM